MRVSRFHASRPMGPTDQPDYVNAVAAFDTTLGPLALLTELQTIEFRHGRRRSGERWGPRVLDLDLLLLGQERHSDARLTVPHAGMQTRAFVLVPLMELAPELRLPDGTAVNTLVSDLDLTGVARLEQPARPGLHAAVA